MTRRDDLVRLRDELKRITEADPRTRLLTDVIQERIKLMDRIAAAILDALIAQEDAAPMTPVIDRGMHE